MFGLSWGPNLWSVPPAFRVLWLDVDMLITTKMFHTLLQLRSLEGIQALPYLKELHIQRNNVTNLVPLASNRNLMCLNAGHNEINSLNNTVNTLQYLTNLKSVILFVSMVTWIQFKEYIRGLWSFLFCFSTGKEWGRKLTRTFQDPTINQFTGRYCIASINPCPSTNQKNQNLRPPCSVCVICFVSKLNSIVLGLSLFKDKTK